MTLPKWESLGLSPVWSPDSTRLLINRSRFDLEAWPNVNIYMLDLRARKFTRKFRNGPPVFGWVRPM
jgi:hypothetical protein